MEHTRDNTMLLEPLSASNSENIHISVVYLSQVSQVTDPIGSVLRKHEEMPQIIFKYLSITSLFQKCIKSSRGVNTNYFFCGAVCGNQHPRCLIKPKVEIQLYDRFR